MSAFTDAIARNMRGVHFLSAGACPGCSECGLDEKDCPDCGGTGRFMPGGPDTETACQRCNGTGKLVPSESDRECADEGGFSWSSCDSCNSGLGGNRYPAHGIIADTMEAAQAPDRTVTHFNVCGDCLCYIANGDEPEDHE